MQSLHKGIHFKCDQWDYNTDRDNHNEHKSHFMKEGLFFVINVITVQQLRIIILDIKKLWVYFLTDNIVWLNIWNLKSPNLSGHLTVWVRPKAPKSWSAKSRLVITVDAIKVGRGHWYLSFTLSAKI